MKIHRHLAVALSTHALVQAPRWVVPLQAGRWRSAQCPGPAPPRAAGPSLASRCLGGGPAPPGTTLRVVFDDPQAYERITGPWSQLVGQAFLDWLAPAPGLRWLDIGCGSGVFTRLIAERCQPACVHGIDPESSQIDHARRLSPQATVQFSRGSALATGFAPGSFDVSVMALVLSHLDDPALGVAQMVRVLAPGGLACAYNWDLSGGGAPVAPLSLAMRQAGVPMAPAGPSEELTGEETISRLWRRAGLRQVQTRAITVQRSFASLDDAWEALQWGARSAALRRASPEQRQRVKDRFQENLQQDTSGPVTCSARAIAVRGWVGS